MKIMLGRLAKAILNNNFINFSLSPTYLLIRSLELIEKKVLFTSEAHAFAKKVLPVPGGPYNKMPFQGLRLPRKICGCRIGKIKVSYRNCFACYKPAISENFIFGFYDTMAFSRF
jgi:hypothetical protein